MKHDTATKLVPWLLLGLLLLAGANQAVTAFVPFGKVILKRDNGTSRVYPLLSSAVDACTGGEEIILAEGTYALSGALTMDTANVTIRGPKNAIISRAGVVATITGNNVKIDGVTVQGRIDISAADGVQLTNMEHTANSQAHCLTAATEANEIRLRNNKYSGATSHGVHFEQCSDQYISDCRFTGNTGDGLRLTDCGGANTGGTALTDLLPPKITGCDAGNNSGYGFAMFGVHDTRIANCNAERNGLAGFYIDCPIQIGISNCSAERDGTLGASVNDAIGGFVLVLGDITVYQNVEGGCATISSCYSYDQPSGIRIVNPLNATTEYIVRLVDNEFYVVPGSPAPQRGMYISDLHADIRLAVDDNNCIGSATTNLFGFHIEADASLDGRSVSFRGNRAIRVARGAQLVNLTGLHVGNFEAIGCDEGVRLPSSTADFRGGRFVGNNTNLITSGSGSVTSVIGVVGITDTGTSTKKFTQLLVPGAQATGDNKAGPLRIPSEWNGYNLVGVAAAVRVGSTSGNPNYQVRRVRAAASADMLSTALTIDANAGTPELDSSTAATPAVINTSNDDVATGDQIFIDCDTAGTGTTDANVTLIFQNP